MYVIYGYIAKITWISVNILWVSTLFWYDKKENDGAVFQYDITV